MEFILYAESKDPCMLLARKDTAGILPTQPVLREWHGFSRPIRANKHAGFIESCITNVLFETQKKRAVSEKGAQKFFLPLQ